jgi:serine protease AprX
LKGRIIKAENYTTEPWGNPDFHGTAVAGIIGSSNKSFRGVAPDVKLYNYKVLATKFGINADDFGGSKAIEKAVEDGMHIANCSWGIEKVSGKVSREAKACNTAWELGLAIVKSAGNNGAGASTLTTPAEADGVIVVGASGKDFKKVEDYSSRGPLPSPFNSLRPHIIAPGGTDADNILSCHINGDFGAVGKGTSYAAPHVSGLLALILEENPGFSNDELRDFAIKLCTKLKGLKPDVQGHGIISLKSLLK